MFFKSAAAVIAIVSALVGGSQTNAMAATEYVVGGLRLFELKGDAPILAVGFYGRSVIATEGGEPGANRSLHWDDGTHDGPELRFTLLVVVNPQPTDGLPDGVRKYSRDRTQAIWLSGPTERYRHGVLGDAIEASGLAVAVAGGEVATLQLAESSVFEDRYPRLADIDGDGQDDIVVVRSYIDAGAALSVWTLKGGHVVNLGESPPIGRPNRWLNPAGIADFDGDGRVEIAAVITPHIGGTLKLYELRDGRLAEKAAEPGFSNHEIGSRVLGMSAVLRGHPDGPVLAVPDTARTTLRIVAFHGGRFAEWHRIPHDSAIATEIVARDLNGDGRDELIYALKDGRLTVVDGAGIGRP